jgi:hypothetical protein
MRSPYRWRENSRDSTHRGAELSTLRSEQSRIYRCLGPARDR